MTAARGTNAYARFPSPSGLGGVGTRTRRQGLGEFKFTLFQLGGLGAVSEEERASAERFKESRWRTAQDEKERSRQAQEQAAAIKAAEEAAERLNEATGKLLESSEVQLSMTMSRVQKIAIYGLGALVLVKFFTREKKGRR